MRSHYKRSNSATNHAATTDDASCSTNITSCDWLGDTCHHRLGSDRCLSHTTNQAVRCHAHNWSSLVHRCLVRDFLLTSFDNSLVDHRLDDLHLWNLDNT